MSPYVRRTGNSGLYMVFDFFKKRSEEGFAQVQNIATKTIQGKLQEALSETASYVSLRRKIDSENLMRLTTGLSRSRDRLLSGINGAFDNESDDIDVRLEKLEEVLLQADIGSVTSTAIVDDLRRYARREGLAVDDILPILRARLIEALTPIDGPSSINFAPAGEPTVIFVIGANGMGKTTTIGKIASRLRNEANLTVLLGACDTFRAAAVEQLGEWAIRANVSIEVPLPAERGGNPVPVVTRSVRRAKEEGFDVCIIDTSGRLSNNFELIEQLQDMKAAILRELPSAPHETLLVVDGSVGRNAVDQATAW
jgi:fused signal recognition particle receptor